MEKEIFSTLVVKCRGRKLLEKWTRIENALDTPVQALITCFKDGTREVCCPHLGPNLEHKKACRATAPVHAHPADGENLIDSYAFCSYTDKEEQW